MGQQSNKVIRMLNFLLSRLKIPNTKVIFCELSELLNATTTRVATSKRLLENLLTRWLEVKLQVINGCEYVCVCVLCVL